MFVKRCKSKWLVLDDERNLLSSHRGRQAAEKALALRQAYIAMANGWDRLSAEQQELIRKDGGHE